MKKQKKSAGFTLMEIVISIAVIGSALGMVGVARQKKERARRQFQTSINQAKQARTKQGEEAKSAPTKEPQTGAKEDTAIQETTTPDVQKPQPETANTRKQKKHEAFDTSEQEAPRLVDEPSDADKRDREKSERKRPQASEGGKDSKGQYVPVYDYYEEQQRQQEEAAIYYQQQQEEQQQLYEQYYYYEQQQQQMFDPNQFMQDPYQQYNPVLEDFYQQMLPGVYPQFFPGQ